MKKTLTLLAVAWCGLALAQGHTDRRAAGAFGQAAAAYTDKLIDHQLALERMQLEADLGRRNALDTLQAIRQQEKSSAQAGDQEVRLLTSMHPQWMRIVTSTAFHGWLSGQGATYQTECKKTNAAPVLAACIDAFLGPPIKVK
ncbi:MAG: hypothetical protein Q8N17_26275 [Burkholderiaceae bacterium]|nr:hypothetical protein [Burkholderiaceae bacterium]